MVPSSRPPSLCGVGPRTTHRPAVRPHCTARARLPCSLRLAPPEDGCAASSLRQPACDSRHPSQPCRHRPTRRVHYCGRQQPCVRGFFSFSPITIRLVNPRFVASVHARHIKIAHRNAVRSTAKAEPAAASNDASGKSVRECVNMRWCGCVRTMRTAGCALKGPNTRDCPPARVCNSNVTTALSVHSQIFFSG